MSRLPVVAQRTAVPSIQVGLVLTAPGNWPDGVNVNGQVWNPTVLSTACQATDFVSVHWYAQQPGNESDQGLLATPYTGNQSTPPIPSMVATLRSEINQYCGAHASQVAIMITETNSVAYNPGKQTTSPINGLFLMEDYLEWLQNGVQNVSWWDLHNGPVTWGNNSPALAGTTNYGDYGILANGDPPEPPANTPFPTFTALQLLRQAMTPGSTFLRASSSLPSVHVYAFRQPAGHLAIVLVNTSASDSYTITALMRNLDRAATATATSFSLASPQLSSAPAGIQRDTVSFTVAPYSATVIDISRGGK